MLQLFVLPSVSSPRPFATISITSDTKVTTNGVAIFNDLTVGTYTVAITDVINGYSIPSAESVVITENNVTKYVTLSCNTLKSSEIKVILKDDDNKAELDGVKVKLYDSSKNKVLSTNITNSSGRSYFDSLEGGTYYIYVDKDAIDQYQLDGEEYTRVVLGNTESKDVTLKFERTINDTENKESSDNDNNNNIADFTTSTGTVTGRIWKDNNNNGKFDESDSALANREIQIKSGSVVIAKTTTGTDGIFSISVIPGNYTVQMVLNTNESMVISKSSESSLDNSIMTQQGSRNIQVIAGSVVTVSGGLSIEATPISTSDKDVISGVESNTDISENSDSKILNLPKTGESNTKNNVVMLSINIVLLIGCIIFLRKAWNTK